MIIAGAWCAIVYQQADIVEVLILQGLSVAAVVMLCLNLLTIQGPTIYNVSAAACHLLRSERRRTLTVVAAGVGILLAIGWGWAPTPWARRWLTCHRGSPRWLALPFPRWSISR